MTLFEIDSAILQCVDPETGEVDTEKLNALEMLRGKKLEDVALWYKNLLSDIEALRLEEKVFTDRRRAKENKAESLKKYLANALDGQRFETAKCDVRFRKSARVEVRDLWSVPEDYLKYSEPTVDKSAVKKAIKNGETVKGCELVESVSITIK